MFSRLWIGVFRGVFTCQILVMYGHGDQIGLGVGEAKSYQAVGVDAKQRRTATVEA